MPELPTTKVYFRPPTQTSPGGAGNELAQTGSGEAPLVIVRSTAGFTVVFSVAVAVTPVFLMLAVAVAVLMRTVPAGDTTLPVMVMVRVPPALSERIAQRTSGAVTTHPLPVPTVPLTTAWVATMPAASSPCVPSTTTTSSARVVLVLVTRTLYVSIWPGLTGSGPAPAITAGSSVLTMVRAGGAGAAVTAVLTVADVLFSSLVSGIALSGSTTAVLVSGPVAGAVTFNRIDAFWPALTEPPVQVTTTVATPDVVHVKRLVVSAEVRTTPVGRVSRTTTLSAWAPPRLLTVRT
jgi:hypothetical protein